MLLVHYSYPAPHILHAAKPELLQTLPGATLSADPTHLPLSA